MEFAKHSGIKKKGKRKKENQSLRNFLKLKKSNKWKKITEFFSAKTELKKGKAILVEFHNIEKVKRIEKVEFYISCGIL